MWHVSSRSGAATLRTAIHLLLTYLLGPIIAISERLVGLYVCLHIPTATSMDRLRGVFFECTCAWWSGGVVARALRLRLQSQVRSAAVPLSGNNLGQVVHTRASVTKQYNLVPVQRRWCPAVGKVTVGLALHWPCVTDFIVLSTVHGLKNGRWHTTLLTAAMWRFPWYRSAFCCSSAM